MTPEQLSQAVLDTVNEAVADGALTLTAVPATVTVERPKNRDHGDYATNVALQLAKAAGLPPRALAELLAERLREVAGIAGVDVAGPGFLNLDAGRRRRRASSRASIVERGAQYGRTETFAGQIGSTWSSSPPTRPARSTSATSAGPRSATRSAGSWRPPAPRSTPSTTSTTPAIR